MSASERYRRAKGLFAAVLPGDRVRIVEEFMVDATSGHVLYYGVDPEVNVEGVSEWEYVPTEHTKEVVVLSNKSGQLDNLPVDAAWAEFYNTNAGTPNRIKSKSSFEAGWEAALRDITEVHE